MCVCICQIRLENERDCVCGCVCDGVCGCGCMGLCVYVWVCVFDREREPVRKVMVLFSVIVFQAQAFYKSVKKKDWLRLWASDLAQCFYSTPTIKLPVLLL